MGKPKTQQLPFEQKQEYGFMEKPQTADYQAFKGFTPMADPTTQYRFGAAKRDLMQTYQNPMGAFTTPEMREQMTRSGLGELGQQEGQAYREQAYDQNRLKMAQLESLMNYSSPQMVNTKTSGFNSQPKQGSGFLGSLIQGAATVGAAFI